MNEYIAFDSHKHYTVIEREGIETRKAVQRRIEHSPGAIRTALAGIEPGTVVAVEAMGSWYWIVSEIEQAGLVPALVHPRKAKLMMGMINKTDKLDVHGLNRLQRNRTLPTVWIAPAGTRDLREVTRTRMVLTQHRARLKNRLLATLAKYGFLVEDCSDSFGFKARKHQWPGLLVKLPEHTRWSAELLLEQLDLVNRQVAEQEKRLGQLLTVTPQMVLLMTLPGVGLILAGVIVMEIGDIARFASAERLASYAGTTPRVHSSGDKTRYGKCRSDVNRYMKWAFVEAGNSIAMNAGKNPQRHVSELYRRLRHRKNHQKAVGAVARHLAEAAYWMLTKGECYKDPVLGRLKEGLSATAACRS